MRSNFLAVIVFSVLALAAVFSAGCGGPPENGGQSPAGSSSKDAPELTDAVINERINDAWLRDVPPEDPTLKPIFWNFDENEPKEIKIIDRQTDGDEVIIVLDIKTSSSPRSREPRYLAGQIRTHWKLKTGFVLRMWEIVETENISMKYQNLPKPPAQNSNSDQQIEIRR